MRALISDLISGTSSPYKFTRTLICMRVTPLGALYRLPYTQTLTPSLFLKPDSHTWGVSDRDQIRDQSLKGNRKAKATLEMLENLARRPKQR
jgi:hypothetical protein